MKRNAPFALVALAVAMIAGAQSPYINKLFAPATMTGTGQTSTPIQLGVKSSSGGYSAGTVTLTGTSLTTATFAVYGSADGGVTYYALAIETCATPGTFATTMTATANGCYQVNLAGLSHVEFVTSGTFTGTSIALQLAASPYAQIGRTGGGVGPPPVTAATYFKTWGFASGGTATIANTLQCYWFAVPGGGLSVGHVSVNLVATPDIGDIGFYSQAGTLLAHIGAQTITPTGQMSLAFTGGTQTIPGGGAYFCITAVAGGIDIVGNLAGDTGLFGFQTTGITTTAGALPASITPPSAPDTSGNHIGMAFILTP